MATMTDTTSMTAADQHALLWADTYMEWNDLAGATADSATADFFYEMADLAKDLTRAFAARDPEHIFA